MFEKLFGKGRDRPHRAGWSCSWANARRHWPPPHGTQHLGPTCGASRMDRLTFNLPGAMSGSRQHLHLEPAR